MRTHSPARSGLTLVELCVTMGLVGILGVIIYSLLNIGIILGAKNTATNTAHQQARVAMLKMIDDLHSAVSLPAMTNATGTPYPIPAPGATPVSAERISFQQWGSAPLNGVMTPNGGPHKIFPKADPLNSAGYPAGQNVIRIVVTAGQPNPIVGQRLIVPTHQIEANITAISGNNTDLSVTLATNLPVDIKGTTSTVGDVICYITDRCAYRVVLDSPGPPASYKLQWTNTQGTRDIVNAITNPKPFSIPTTPAGALYNRFVAAVDLSTSDPKYSNRGYKAANILLNGLVPYKARLTTSQ